MTSSLRTFWLPVTGFWLVVAIYAVARTLWQFDSVPLLVDTDDAMRMATATDLLHGQAWQDLIQHRDNVPFGASMHWSRLVDAPIALLIGIGGPDFAAIAWPLLLLLPLLLLSAAVTRVLVPGAGIFTALVLPVLNLVLDIEFTPGRVDHHNVQIVLTQAMLLALLLGRQRAWGAALAGVLAATSLAIGLETLPIVLAAITLMTALWLWQPHAYRRGLAVFGASFGLATTAHFVLATAPALYLAEACDVVSMPYVLAALLGGGGLVVAALATSRLGLPIRLASIAVIGVLVLAATALLYPDCLRGPYAQVPRDIIDGMFSRIGEAQPLWTRFLAQPSVGFAFGGATLIAVPLTAWIALRETGERRVSWLIVLALLAVAALVMVLQIRGARLAAALALPAGAWLITTARNAYRERGSAGRALGLIGSWLLFATMAQPILLALAGELVPSSRAQGQAEPVAKPTSPDDCLMGRSFAALAALPPGRIAAPIGLSSHILRYTSHSVLSAGFHRNAQSIRDVDAFFNDDEAAQRIARERGLDYVVTCPVASDLAGWAKGGAARNWLLPLSAPQDVLQVYRIDLGR